MEAVAAKRLIAFQLRELMKKQKLTKVQLAKRMKTRRSALARAARALGISIVSGLSLPPKSEMPGYDSALVRCATINSPHIHIFHVLFFLVTS